ncbi:MAG: GAF domain-containing protein, partial [Snowella sp.]
PGAIQPHGLLLVISPLEWQITQISRNTQEFLGIEPEQLLGQPLDRLLPTDKIEAIAACLEGDFEQINPLKLSLETQNGTKKFNGIVHSLDENNIILELEINKSENDLNFIQFSQISKRILLQIQRASTLNELCQIMVQQIRKLTGFDRVMIYQFDQTGAGNVIAEDRTEGLESFLGLHYPDSDIPRQAKYLYTLNFLRLIPRIDYQPVPILTLDDAINKPLDMSLSILRSVSPLHIEYLQNMGVGASLSISLLKQGKLWGLIACHHQSPYFVPYETRNICEFLGQVMSLELASKEANEDLDYKIFLKSVQSQLVNALGKAENIRDALLRDREKLLKLVNATGVVIYTEENLLRIGQTPPEEVLPDLIAWLENRFEQDLFITHSLPKIYPDAIAFKEVACG